MNVVRDAAVRGLTQAGAARELGVSMQTLRNWARRGGIVFRECPSGRNTERAEAMSALYRRGKTLQEIGDSFGITRERVRQILFHSNISAKDGGYSIKTKVIRDRAASLKEQRCLAEKGCTREQYRELLRIGREMQAAGLHQSRTPTGAFTNQKRNSANRGIAWELTLWQWWSIWVQSGKWEMRGRGQGYGMYRIGCAGPYSAGNVFIGESMEDAFSCQVDRPLGHAEYLSCKGAPQ